MAFILFYFSNRTDVSEKLWKIALKYKCKKQTKLPLKTLGARVEYDSNIYCLLLPKYSFWLKIIIVHNF